MQPNLADILSDLNSLNDHSAFKKKFSQTFSTFGFNAFSYVGLKSEAAQDQSGKIDLSDVIVLTNVNSSWADHYLEEGYQDDDPLIKECITNRLPLRWTEQFRSNLRSKREDAILTDGFDYGVRRGFTVPIHGPKRELGIMSLYSDLTDREFMDMLDARQHDLHVMSLYFHDAVQKALTQVEIAPLPIPLTDREVEILQWTAHGKTAWEIGSILNISERTVNFHLQNAMSKFGVHNKTHAASKAVSVGLIHP
jgi:LuxR family transcriptional activator of bioluminescence operon